MSTLTKKILNITTKVISWIVMAVAVFMMIFTIFSTLTFDRNDRNFFGIRFYIVLSDSMSLSENNKDDDVHFDAGDIVLIKNVKDATALEPGQIIAFISQSSSSFGETVTHKIRERRETEDGITYVTYGTNKGVDDDSLVEPEYVLGTYAGKLPLVGRFFAFLKTTPGYMVCILIPFLLLILWQGVNTIRLFKRYRQEQMADMNAEREAIAAERAQNEEMLRELQRLKEQLAMQTGELKTPSKDGEEESVSADSPENINEETEQPLSDGSENTEN